jgi:hypothetical protein
MEEDGRW